jgi:hypothetical protein
MNQTKSDSSMGAKINGVDLSKGELKLIDFNHSRLFEETL